MKEPVFIISSVATYCELDLWTWSVIKPISLNQQVEFEYLAPRYPCSCLDFSKKQPLESWNYIQGIANIVCILRGFHILIFFRCWRRREWLSLCFAPYWPRFSSLRFFSQAMPKSTSSITTSSWWRQDLSWRKGKWITSMRLWRSWWGAKENDTQKCHNTRSHLQGPHFL